MRRWSHARRLASTCLLLVGVIVPADAAPQASPSSGALTPQRSTAERRDTAAAPATDRAAALPPDSAAESPASPAPLLGDTADAPASSATAASRLRAADDSARAASTQRAILGDLSLVQAIVAIILAALAFVLGYEALQLFQRYGEMVRRDESLGVTSHWGGFGGGASGWRASPALALLAGALILLGGATTVALSLVAGVIGGRGPAAASSAPAAPAATPGDAPGS